MAGKPPPWGMTVYPPFWACKSPLRVDGVLNALILDESFLLVRFWSASLIQEEARRKRIGYKPEVFGPPGLAPPMKNIFKSEGKEKYFRWERPRISAGILSASGLIPHASCLAPRSCPVS